MLFVCYACSSRQTSKWRIFVFLREENSSLSLNFLFFMCLSLGRIRIRNRVIIQYCCAPIRITLILFCSTENYFQQCVLSPSSLQSNLIYSSVTLSSLNIHISYLNQRRMQMRAQPTQPNLYRAPLSIVIVCQ